MNKQEAIERIEKLDEHYGISEGISEGVYLEKREVVNIVSKIQEPRTKHRNLTFDLIVLSLLVVFIITVWAIIIGMIGMFFEK